MLFIPVNSLFLSSVDIFISTIGGVFSVLDQYNWLVDSGALFYVCRNIEVFSEYKKGLVGLFRMTTASGETIRGEE